MKIGVLTYHRVVNDGSILQSYCGQKALSKQFPNDRVEIIDYSPARLWWTENRKIFSKRIPFFRPSFITKKASTSKFVREYLKLSPQACLTDDLHKAIRFIEEQDYEVVFVGSDTVWEARYSQYVPYPPNIYYLPGINCFKKISYAASADPLTPDFIANQNISELIASHIQEFDHISVRDQATREYLTNLGIAREDIHFMPDPTLQCDFDELVLKPRLPKQKPWAGIGYSRNIKRAVVKQLRTKGYDIVDLGNFSLNGKPIPGAAISVNIRLGVMSMLDFLITDRFHSSIFAFKLAGAPVVFVESAKKWADPNSKGRDLFRKLGLESMVWRYESGEFSSNLIDNYLKVWQELNVNLEDKFTKLRTGSEAELKSVIKSLGI